MSYVTVPAIEFAIFLIMIQDRIEIWKPRWSNGGVTLGDTYSTLYAMSRADGSVLFMTHRPDEIRELAEFLLEEFGVETWPV